jgi:hypothetical protein
MSNVRRQNVTPTHDYTFSGDTRPDSRLFEAWRTAMDIRKFEIELYWKRATYFWTFIGLTLAAYGSVLTARDDSALKVAARSDVLFGIACVGLVFAVAWYFVNRGSKFWQRNWEYQVDLLEDQAVGPLYKTVFANRKDTLWSPTGAYPFSVSNINHVLSLFIVVLFVLLAAYSMPCVGITATCTASMSKVVVAALSALFVYLLYRWGRTSAMRAANALDPSAVVHAPVEMRFSVRTVDISR